MNEHYSGEISRNTRLSLNMQRSEGKAVTPNVPYGYIENPNNSYKFIINEDVAFVIIKIYELALSGMGVKY